MSSQYDKTAAIIEAHLRSFLPGHEPAFERWEKGPAQTLELMSKLRVAKFNPPANQNEGWDYCTIGAWEFSNEPHTGFEFMILMPFETRRATEILTMAANYHRTQTLGFGHRFPIGEGWLPDSQCDHIFVLLPYTFGPDFEVCRVSDDYHIHIAWLLPITKAEKDFARSKGVEALEQKLEEAEVEYLNPNRGSVI